MTFKVSQSLNMEGANFSGWRGELMELQGREGRERKGGDYQDRSQDIIE